MDEGAIPKFMYDKNTYDESMSEKEIKDYVGKLEEKMLNEYLSKFDDSKILMLNMSFVMLFTILEIYFEHIFSTIINANRNVLMTLSKDKNITLESMMKCSNLEEAIDKIKFKCVDEILRKGIKDILGSFESIGVRKNKIFSWQGFNDDVKKQLNSWDEIKLIEIYEERNSIIHDNELVIRTANEFIKRKTFLEKIIISLGLTVANKFFKYCVLTDLQVVLLMAQGYTEFDPDKFNPPPE